MGTGRPPCTQPVADVGGQVDVAGAELIHRLGPVDARQVIDQVCHGQALGQFRQRVLLVELQNSNIGQLFQPGRSGSCR